MPRFDRRALQWIDVIGSFEGRPHSHHVRHVMGMIARIKEDGLKLWQEGSSPSARWDEACSDLWTFLNTLGARRHNQDLETAMREFIHAFEHAYDRMYQMMFKIASDPHNDPITRPIMDLLNWAFVASIYALVSGWIDDKHDNVLFKSIMNLRTEEVSQEVERTEMRVPKPYQKFVKRM